MAMQGGLSKEDATEVVSEKVPPVALVPIFNKRGMETLRRHLLVKHEIEIEGRFGQVFFNMTDHFFTNNGEVNPLGHILVKMIDKCFNPICRGCIIIIVKGTNKHTKKKGCAIL